MCLTLRLSFTKSVRFRAKRKRTLSLSWSWPEYHGLCVTLSFSLRLHTLQSTSIPSILCQFLRLIFQGKACQTLVLALVVCPSELILCWEVDCWANSLHANWVQSQQTKRPLFVAFSLRVCHFLSLHLVPILGLGPKQNINFFAPSQTHTSYTWGMARMALPS